MRRSRPSLNPARFLTACVLALSAGCVSDQPQPQGPIAAYQRDLADKGPQTRVDTEGQKASSTLGLLIPTEPNTPAPSIQPGQAPTRINLTLNQALSKALANSPEVRLVSFEPALAEQEMAKKAGDFDPTLFARYNYERAEKPTTTLSEIGNSETHLFETGIKQRDTFGGEWSSSYVLTRTWDDLRGRTMQGRYEPLLALQFRQPLLRDAGADTAMAGVNIARLNYQATLLGFRQKVEELATAVIAAYWQVYQARAEYTLGQQWLDMASETLNKVEGRRDIDATEIHIKQAQSSAWVRESSLLEAKKRLADVQDGLTRLLADPNVNLLSNVEMVPASEPHTELFIRPYTEVLQTALQYNPVLHQSRLAIDVADINIRVAKNQRMPKLDLVLSGNTQALAPSTDEAHRDLLDGYYAGGGVGLSFEYPLGNRSRDAELLHRNIERRKAVTAMQNVADQLALQAKERLRKVQTSFNQIEIQRQAVDAARIHLRALEDSEEVRENLTPEYLLVKLQGQDALVYAERARIKALVDYNTGLAELAQTMGIVLTLQEVKLPAPAKTVRPETPEAQASGPETPDPGD